MEPIERQLAERKALLKQWAAEIERLQAAKIGMSEREGLEIDLQIATLGYKISCGEFAIRDIEEIIAEGRAPKRERPPLPKARRLSVVERQRIEREERARLLSVMPPSTAMEIHVHVGRMTDEQGNPRVHVHIGPKGRGLDDA